MQYMTPGVLQFVKKGKYKIIYIGHTCIYVNSWKDTKEVSGRGNFTRYVFYNFKPGKYIIYF